MIRHIRWLCLLVLLPSMISCTKKEDEKKEKTYKFCSGKETKVDLLKVFNGNLVFVSEQSENGAELADMMKGAVVGLIANGFNYKALSKYKAKFSNGDYSLKSGDYGYTFSFYFAQAFGTYAAGDKIPYNLFDYESYIKDVDIGTTNDFPPEVTYDYNDGPLHSWISGGIDLSGEALDDINVEFKLDTSKISFGLNTAGEYNGAEPRTDDVLKISMTTTPALLTDIQNEIAAGTFGISYSESTYNSAYYKLLQAFYDTTFYLKKDEDNGYYWEGEYNSTVTQGEKKFYQKGIASSKNQNYTDYYCDAAYATKAGRALHDADLKGGTFTFEDGVGFKYRLEEF